MPQPDFAAAPLNGTMLDRAMRWSFALLRVAAGLLFMQHGIQKLFGAFGGARVVDLMTQFGLAGVLELLGGLLLVVGLLTRPVALVLAAEMAVAYAQVHAPQDPVPIVNKGELALVYMVVFLFFAAHGGGPLSLDARRRGRRR